MEIKGFQKTTMIDYPGKVASIVFTGGCNFKCPFCHNGDLVMKFEQYDTIPQKQVMEHLVKRRNLLDGIVISGGEPTLSKGIYEFIRQVKALDMKVKLDTNGYKPEVLKTLLEDGLVDYVAMDIKNSLERYSVTTGLYQLEVDKINRSIGHIIDSGIAHEFRTTLIREFHGDEDVLMMGSMINGAENYYLQQYESSDKELKGEKYNFYTVEEMKVFKEMISDRFNIGNIGIRGRF